MNNHKPTCDRCGNPVTGNLRYCISCYATLEPPRKQLTKRMRFNVLNRDGFRCRYCGRDASSGIILEVDHIDPNGQTIEENLCAACLDCNGGKNKLRVLHLPPPPSISPNVQPNKTDLSISYENRTLILPKNLAETIMLLSKDSHRSFSETILWLLREVTDDIIEELNLPYEMHRPRIEEQRES